MTPVRVLVVSDEIDPSLGPESLAELRPDLLVSCGDLPFDHLEDLLTRIAQATTGSYHRAGDARALDRVYRSLDLRLTAKPQVVELTGAAVAVAVALLTVGGLLMIIWYGRIV